MRRWLAWRLLELARWVHPSGSWSGGGVWQIIEVPRRISETEAREFAGQVRNL